MTNIAADRRASRDWSPVPRSRISVAAGLPAAIARALAG